MAGAAPSLAMRRRGADVGEHGALPTLDGDVAEREDPDRTVAVDDRDPAQRALAHHGERAVLVVGGEDGHPRARHVVAVGRVGGAPGGERTQTMSRS